MCIRDRTTPLEVAAIVAFGYGEKTQKKLRLNILNMSMVDVTVERQYCAPKKGIRELVSVDTVSYTHLDVYKRQE